jgi:hypothetical protein
MADIPDDIARVTDPTPEFMIVDLGTSRFTKPGDLVQRHWKVLHQTIRRLLRPLDIDKMWSHQKMEEFNTAACTWHDRPTSARTTSSSTRLGPHSRQSE